MRVFTHEPVRIRDRRWAAAARFRANVPFEAILSAARWVDGQVWGRMRVFTHEPVRIGDRRRTAAATSRANVLFDAILSAQPGIGGHVPRECGVPHECAGQGDA
jgi:hypothetical protein